MRKARIYQNEQPVHKTLQHERGTREPKGMELTLGGLTTAYKVCKLIVYSIGEKGRSSQGIRG